MKKKRIFTFRETSSPQIGSLSQNEQIFQSAARGISAAPSPSCSAQTGEDNKA
jgi:hypothetical protein